MALSILDGVIQALLTPGAKQNLHHSTAIFALKDSWDYRFALMRAGTAWIAGADRWTEATWRDLEQQVGASQDEGANEPTEPQAENVAGVVRRRPDRGGRRTFLSSYMR